MAEMLVKSKVKEFVKSVDPEMRVSPEFYDALEAEVKVLVEKAIKRAQAEGRKTLYARHV
jgi:histone H3/H4